MLNGDKGGNEADENANLVIRRKSLYPLLYSLMHVQSITKQMSLPHLLTNTMLSGMPVLSELLNHGCRLMSMTAQLISKDLLPFELTETLL